MQKSGKLYTNTFFVALCAVLCCALWGSATPFIKIGYELILPQKTVPSTILFAGIRFTLAGLITVVIYSIARRKFLYPKKENLLKVATVSCFQTVIQYIFFYIGLANTTGVKGTILSGSNAFFALLVAGLVFRQEKLTVKKITACIIGFAGIIFVNLEGLDFNMNFTGDAFVLFSAIAYAFSSVLIKNYSRYEDPVVISGYQFILGGIVMIIGGLIFGGRVVFDSSEAVGVLVYLAFLSAIAYSLWGILLKYNPVSKVTIYSFMIPVFGVLLSSIMLKEQIKSFAYFVLGCVADGGAQNLIYIPVNLIITLVLVCTGIVMINYKKD